MNIENWHNNFILLTFDRMPSTHVYAKTLARRDNNDENFVIWAHSQTNAIGRNNRVWHSDSKYNLYFSLLMKKPKFSAREISVMPILSAVAMGEAIKPCLADKFTLSYKWPNDIMINGRKVAGILMESSFRGGQCSWFTIGIGVNIDSHPNLAEGTTALCEVSEQFLEAGNLLDQFMQNFLYYTDILTHNGFGPIREKWMQHALFIGERHKIRLLFEEISGTIEGLNKDGKLILRLDNNNIREIEYGEM